MNLEYILDFIKSTPDPLMVIIALLSATFTGIQAFLLFKTLKVAKEFLPQHEEKLKVERKRLAAENGLRALIKVDQIIQMLFSPMPLVRIQIYEKVFALTDLKVDNISEEQVKESRQRLFAVHIFNHNFRLYEPELLDFTKELKLNGMLLNSEEIDALLLDFDRSIAAITNRMLFETNNYIDYKLNFETFNWLKNNIPLSMDDSDVEIVKKYDESGYLIKEIFLKIVR